MPKYARKNYNSSKRRTHSYRKPHRYQVRGSRIPRPLVSKDSVVYADCVSRQTVSVLNREIPSGSANNQYYSLSVAWNNYKSSAVGPGNFGINASGTQFLNMYPQFEEFTITGIAIKWIPSAYQCQGIASGTLFGAINKIIMFDDANTLTPLSLSDTVPATNAKSEAQALNRRGSRIFTNK